MGRYLERYQKGKYADEALSEVGRLMEMLAADKKNERMYDWPAEPEDIRELGKLLDELRDITAKTAGARTARVLEQLAAIKLF
jgi:hypothetical protein